MRSKLLVDNAKLESITVSDVQSSAAKIWMIFFLLDGNWSIKKKRKEKIEQ